MKLIKLNAISSTNDYLKSLLEETVVQDETVVWAKAQRQGRGMMGNSWVSRDGQSLTFSIFKQFSNLTPVQHVYINYAVALGIISALKDLKIPGLSIKWANDIMSENKKICGILLENQIVNHRIKSSIIGIGVNVNEETMEDLPQAGSLYISGGVKFDLEDVLKILTEHVLTQLARLSSPGFEMLKTEFEDLLFRRNEVTVFEDIHGVRFNGIIQGVTNSGRLMLKMEDDQVHDFGLKELKMLY